MLTGDVISVIASYSDVNDMISLLSTNKYYRKFFFSELIWSKIFQARCPGLTYNDVIGVFEFDKMLPAISNNDTAIRSRFYKQIIDLRSLIAHIIILNYQIELGKVILSKSRYEDVYYPEVDQICNYWKKWRIYSYESEDQKHNVASDWMFRRYSYHAMFYPHIRSFNNGSPVLRLKDGDCVINYDSTKNDFGQFSDYTCFRVDLNFNNFATILCPDYSSSCYEWKCRDPSLSYILDIPAYIKIPSNIFEFEHPDEVKIELDLDTNSARLDYKHLKWRLVSTALFKETSYPSVKSWYKQYTSKNCQKTICLILQENLDSDESSDSDFETGPYEKDLYDEDDREIVFFAWD